ncbi:Chorion peroxidase [Amphibalanus amphitrite]|uniref:Chorion peroxidase n=1 Tax=Amphibalanus amphitrite TaxID=1232801 RepID=A0A6A4W8V6_AMPAM|nr:Chorion peroxidase [Amphibalanus amphitrite]
MVFQMITQLLWLWPALAAAAVSDQSLCRPAAQCLPADGLPGAGRSCTLPDGSAGRLCRLEAPRQQRRLGLGALAPLGGAASDERLQLSASADQQLAHQAGVSALQLLRQANQRLQTADDTSSQMIFWNSPSSSNVLAMGYSALQHLETMKQMQPRSLRRRRQRRQANLERITPSDLSIWNSPSSEEAQMKGVNALQALLLMMRQGQSTNQLLRRTRRQADPHLVPGCTPEPEPRCDAGHRYRTASGECNNLKHPLWGRSLAKQIRLLADTFDDGVFTPRRRARSGDPLPSARFISQRTMDSMATEAAAHTLSVMQMGQFIDHDITQVPIFRLDTGAGIECCEQNGARLPSVPRHPLCIPLDIPADDPFYSRHRLRCMNMVRSLPAPEPDCIARPASQLNAPTQLLDASNVYGSTDEQTAELRSFSNGRLRTSTNHMLPDKGTEPAGRSLAGGCPHSRTARMIGEPPDGRCRGHVCFQAGDERVNEQTGLAVVHTVFVRLHNHIVEQLQRNHPTWDDERLFQEGRRVLGAMMQHVTYNEWLPAVIGREFARRHGLLPLQSGYSTLYSEDVDPRISTEFSTAAFRFGHSMVRDKLTLLGADGRVTHTVNLTSTFFEPSGLMRYGMADFVRMLTTMRSMQFDMSVAKAVHEKLFNADQDHGLDLISLNVQRGREHGIPTYASVLSACTGQKIREFSDLLSVMKQKDMLRLMRVYQDVADVDLFIGGLAEAAADDALVGPTFRCVIAQQFFGLRYGDRFFYDNGGMVHSFTPRQLQELRKASFAGILCETLGAKYGDDFSRVQPLAFTMPSSKNPLQSCHSAAISRVDYSVF